MPRPRFAILVAVSLFALSGCPGPTVDGTSDEALKTSTTRMRDGLTEDKRKAFDEALQTLAFANIDSLGGLLLAGQDPETLRADIRRQLAGKTVDQIIDEAKKVKAERQARAEKERAEAEAKAAKARAEAEARAAAESAEREARERERKLQKIGELRTQLEAADAARERLKKFEIGVSRLALLDAGFVRRQQIHLEVTNGTGQTLSRAYFQAEVLTPGRDLPWVSTGFNHEIPGGLQAGESAIWQLSPSMFGDFGRAPLDRADCLLVVACQKLEGAKGEVLANDGWDKDAEDNLRKLLTEIEHPERAQIEAQMEARTANRLLWRAREIRRQLQLEVDALEAKMRIAETRMQQLAKFRVTRAKFYCSKNTFSTDPVIELAAVNETGTTISRAFIIASVTAPDRELSLLEAEFNFSCDGGLAPGASEEWKLVPNRFSDWGRLPADRNDLAIALRIKDLHGPDGKSINGSPPFTEADDKRLKSLLAVRETTAGD